jgi:hypothetical protein
MSTPFIYGETSNHTIGGSLIPDTDVIHNLGSSTQRWRDLYLSGNTINIGGTTISRQEDGSIGITDTLAVGGPTPATLKVSKIMSATGDIINMSGATLSNVSIAANRIKVTGIPEYSYTAPELRILNEDTSSGLVVNQTGQTSVGVADFQDHGISALNIAKGGSITVGNLLLPVMVPTGPAIKVIGSALFDGDMAVQGTHTASSLNVSNAGTGTAMTINQSNVTQPIVEFKDDGLTIFKIVPGGNIGVGTTLPAYKLHVVGTTFSSAGFMSYSDSSLKTNVQEIESADALSIVSQMRGVRYDRIKKEEDPRRRVGLIAQEVECVLPEIVRTDANGMKSVAYGDSVAVLIQAIKEQQKEIDALETMI